MSDMDPVSKLLLGMMKNKKSVFSQIVKDFEICQKNVEAFDILIQRLNDGEKLGDKLNPEKIHMAYARAMRQQYDLIMRLLVMTMVYTGGNDFDADLARCLSKLGHGDLAVKQMFQNKMNGD